MIIMILGAFRSRFGGLRCAHVRPGEICNFAAYAFVEAIVVVRLFLAFQSDGAQKSHLCTDPHGCLIRRDIRYPVPRRPQREIVALWLDRVYPMQPWGLHPSFECSGRTERHEYCGFQEVVPRAWIPVLGIGRDRIFCYFGHLGGPEVWTQVHVAVHWSLQFDWRSEC